MGWFSGGDKHTGWHTSDGKAVTDRQAERIVAEADRKYAAGKQAPTRKGK